MLQINWLNYIYDAYLVLIFQSIFCVHRFYVSVWFFHPQTDYELKYLKATPRLMFLSFFRMLFLPHALKKKIYQMIALIYLSLFFLQLSLIVVCLIKSFILVPCLMLCFHRQRALFCCFHSMDHCDGACAISILSFVVPLLWSIPWSIHFHFWDGREGDAAESAK